MNQFIQKYDENVTGTLSGWDRVVFRGTLRALCFVDGMMGYLSRAGVLLKDFGEHAQAMTRRLIEASLPIPNRAAAQTNANANKRGQAFTLQKRRAVLYCRHATLATDQLSGCGLPRYLPWKRAWY